MRARVYLRIAPTSRGFRYQATTKPSRAPIMDGSGQFAEPLPTIALGVDLLLPDDVFAVPVVGELVVRDSDVAPLVSVELVESEPAS
jgi:hypothetical protein